MELTEEKFAEIVNQNEARIKHLCRIYADRKQEEKDLFQEILIQLWRSLPSFEGDSRVDTWAYRVAVNTAISFIRKKKTRRDYHSKYRQEKESKAEQGNHPQHQSGEGQVDQLYEAISALNASEKTIITMYLEDFSYSEIAYVTDISENYVGVKLHRIREKLSNIIET